MNNICRKYVKYVLHTKKYIPQQIIVYNEICFGHDMMNDGALSAPYQSFSPRHCEAQFKIYLELIPSSTASTPKQSSCANSLSNSEQFEMAQVTFKD